ncbi:hypothetical protein [Sphingomonas sp. LaA6.9]|uniref:hypothetical protein n=1 Tax=Sphingomonas sp. LaA6.9 TaxID=2919914 RepID=UPI001F4F6809|nr:hypothetical protein [Sphingomonas sp. LaA6.9]MCJ8157793.1 hypothetical protein [Sphingomonas sp. LaA6.9]
MHRPTTIERAYQLARSGTCASVQDIRQQLNHEHHEAVEAHLLGPTIVHHLRELCQRAAHGVTK